MPEVISDAKTILTEKILRLVSLPCSPQELEDALLHAAHEGHWHDAEIRQKDRQLVIIYNEIEEK